MFRSLCTIAPLLLLAFGIYAGDAPQAPVSISIPDQKTLKFVYTSIADFGPSCEFELSYERLSSAPTNASVLCEAYSENERGDAKFEFAVYHSVKIPDTKGKVKVHILPVTQPKEPPTDPSSATRPTGRSDWNSSAMAGFAAAHG